jgi:hypothetical protein
MTAEEQRKILEWSIMSPTSSVSPSARSLSATRPNRGGSSPRCGRSQGPPSPAAAVLRLGEGFGFAAPERFPARRLRRARSRLRSSITADIKRRAMCDSWVSWVRARPYLTQAFDGESAPTSLGLEAIARSSRECLFPQPSGLEGFLFVVELANAHNHPVPDFQATLGVAA